MFICLALFLSFLVPFNAYAEEPETDPNFSFDSDIALYAVSDDDAATIGAWLQEIADTLYKFENSVNGKFDSIYNKITTERANITSYIATKFADWQTYYDGKYESLWNKISTERANITSDSASRFASLSADIQQKYESLFDKITAERSVITTDNAVRFSTLTSYIEQQFTALTGEMQQQSSDIQNNASQNSQNEIDNANKNQEEIMNGDKEYDEYEFSSGLTDVLVKLEEYCDSLDDTLLQIDNASDVASSYIAQGTSVINGVFGILPGAVIALITFGIVFIFARKVVGR